MQPGQALALAEHGQHVEDRGEVVRPVSAARSGCATLPSLTPVALGEGAHRLLGRLGAPRLDALEFFRDAGQQLARFGRQQRRGLVVERRAAGRRR